LPFAFFFAIDIFACFRRRLLILASFFDTLSFSPRHFRRFHYFTCPEGYRRQRADARQQRFFACLLFLMPPTLSFQRRLVSRCFIAIDYATLISFITPSPPVSPLRCLPATPIFQLSPIAFLRRFFDSAIYFSPANRPDNISIAFRCDTPRHARTLTPRSPMSRCQIAIAPRRLPAAMPLYFRAATARRTRARLPDTARLSPSERVVLF
jgi:hypothetical protein